MTFVNITRFAKHKNNEIPDSKELSLLQANETSAIIIKLTVFNELFGNKAVHFVHSFDLFYTTMSNL